MKLYYIVMCNLIGGSCLEAIFDEEDSAKKFIEKSSMKNRLSLEVKEENNFPNWYKKYINLYKD